MIRVIGFGSWRMPVTPTEATGIGHACDHKALYPRHPDSQRRPFRHSRSRRRGYRDPVTVTTLNTP